MKDLTIEQLEAQKSAINTARFLMENMHNGNEQTIKDLSDVYNQIDNEILTRLIK